MDQQSSSATASAASGYLLVLLAASLWATIGIIYQFLAGFGIPPLAVAAFRAGLGGLLLLAGLLILRPAWLRIHRQAVGMVAVYGVFGIALFYATYVNAVLTAGVAVASVLMYTAPAWVALIAWRFLDEKLTRTHLLAILLSLAGCALVAQIYDPTLLRLNWPGIVLGLLSGLTYGLWSVLNKVGVRYTNPWTLQCYGMLVGGLVLILLQSLTPLAAALQSPIAVTWLLIMAVGPTVGASVAYAGGVQRIPVSTASVVATVEPVIAVLLAWLVLGETLSLGQLAGAVLIMSAVWLLRPRAEADPIPKSKIRNSTTGDKP